MDDHERLAERFEAHRTRLRAVAYRMLGSFSEADDAAQEAWLRLSRSDIGGVENLGGWLTTVVARVCLDMLRARTSRREEPLGAHLPDAIASPADGTDPEHDALLADAVGPPLLLILDTLAPAERVSFVLHDLFAVPFDQMPPSSGAPRPRHGSSPAARAVGYDEQPRLPTPISPASGMSSTHSSRPRAMATSARYSRYSRCSRCSIPMPCSGPIPRPCRWAHRKRSAARRPWPPPSRGVLRQHNRRWSTEPLEPYGLPADGHVLSSPSRSRERRSSRSTSSPTPRACASSTC